MLLYRVKKENQLSNKKDAICSFLFQKLTVNHEHASDGILLHSKSTLETGSPKSSAQLLVCLNNSRSLYELSLLLHCICNQLNRTLAQINQLGKEAVGGQNWQ